MDETVISGDPRAAATGAGAAYRAAIDHSLDDAHNGLRYMLLRLSLLGLSERDREQLAELAGVAFQEADVSAAAGRIRDAADASPLAVAIADLVQQTGQTSKKATMLGAVAGAYAGLRGAGGGSGDSAVLKGILGAVAGATATATSAFLGDFLATNAWRGFLEKH